MADDISIEIRFCLNVYFPSVRTQNWMEEFSGLALKYAAELGRIVTHFEFWPMDNKTRSPMLRYIKRNQARLVEASGGGSYRGISFYSKDEGAFWSPLYLSLVTEEPLLLRITGMEDSIVYYDYGTVLMDCRLDYLKRYSAEISISKQFLHDIKSIMNPGYGVITTMQERKYPRDYFRDSASSPDLTPEEEREIKIWKREGYRFQKLVRDIYWGNVITRNHWGNDKGKEQYLLRALRDECGDNVFWIDQNTLFFCGPFDICTQDDPRMLDFKERLYKVFDELGIEVIRAHLENYPEPEVELPVNLVQDDSGKKPKKLQSKKKLIIRYLMVSDSETTKEHECVSEMLGRLGRLPLIIKPENTKDGRCVEITVDGHKVPKVREAIISLMRDLNMNIEIEPAIDQEDLDSYSNR